MSIVDKVIKRVFGGEEDISEYEQLVSRMVDAQSDLTILYTKIEDMIDGKWVLPEEVGELDWVGPVISSDPDSALETGVRTVGAENAKFFMTPMGPGENNQKVADDLESWIEWEWKWADFRADQKTTKDIVRSAMTYGRICVHVTNLEHEIEALEDSGADTEFYDQVDGYGSHDIRVASPKNVFYRRGRWGLEAVAHVYKCSVTDAIDDYRGLTDKLEEDYKQGGYEEFEVKVVDLTTRKKRVIWINRIGLIKAEGDISTNEPSEDAAPSKYILMVEDREMPFIPWIIRSGGTSLRSEVKKQVKPMLAKIVETNLWEIQNVILSLTYSEAIATSAQPRFAIVGPNGEITAVDYRDPTRLMIVPEGHTLIQLQAREIDQGMLHLSDRIKAMLDRETVARFLQNLDIPDEAAFASINAVMQSAIAALDVYKEMAEDAHAEIGQMMLKFMHYREDVAVMYGVGDQKEQVLVKWTDFDPKALYIESELSAKAPTDYMQRINAAVALNQQLWFPREEAYRFLSVPNPKELEAKHVQEQINDFVLKQKLTEYQVRIQERLRKELTPPPQQAPPQQGPPPQGPPPQQGSLEGGGGSGARPTPEQRAAFAMAQRSGNRFNPAMRGTSPAVINPSETREQVTGEDRQGEPIA